MEARELEGPGELAGRLADAVIEDVLEELVRVRLPDGEAGEGSIEDFSEGGASLELGLTIPVFVLDWDAGEGHYVVSREKGTRLAAFEAVRAAYKAGEPVEGTIVGFAQGGFHVDIGVQAFLPASQLSGRAGVASAKALGQSLRFKILKFEERRHNIVLSRRALLQEERDRCFASLEVGKRVEATVKRLVDYGAFVAVGSVQGLVHNSDLTWGRIHYPSEVVRVGDSVTVQVLKVDKAKGQVSFGLRQTQESPWDTVLERYPRGTHVSGPVISKTDFGVFIALEPGIDGLVHTAEGVASREARDFLRKVDIGSTLHAEVADVNVEQRRLSLVVVRKS
jgi:small subunit ribosomal protein S1